MSLTGLAYPLQVDEFGGLKTTSDEEYIAGLIRSFIETELGERIGLEDTYGTPDYLFSSYPSFGFVGKDLEQKLTASIPQAEFAVRSSLNDAGEGVVEIFWSYLGVEQEPQIFILETGATLNG